MYTHTHLYTHIYIFVLFSEENVNCSVLSNTLRPRGLYLGPWDPPGKNTGVGCRSFLHGVFLTQGWIPGLPHCRQILYHLSHQGKVSYNYKDPKGQSSHSISSERGEVYSL